jgi:hypothetical protein
MLGYIRAYIDFIFRPLPTHPTPTGWDAVDNMPMQILFYTGVFTFLILFFPAMAKWLYPKWYDGLDKRKKMEFPTYAGCTFHHLTMVPLAWVHVIQDAMRPESVWRTFDYSLYECVFSPVCIGYLIADTIWFAIPVTIHNKSVDYLIHHILTLYLTYAAFTVAPGHVTRFIPHLVICDSSNIFFNFAWLLSICGWKDHPIVQYLELGFAIAFFFIRVINLSLVIIAMLSWKDIHMVGVLPQVTLVIISMLQWYWLFIIIKKSFGRFGKRKENADSSVKTKKVN